MNLDRFSQPGYQEQTYQCTQCGHDFHWTKLDEGGVCPDCVVTTEEESKENDPTPDTSS